MRDDSLDPSHVAGTVLALHREPISPELVLIDPDLAKRERARLLELAQLEEYLVEQQARLENRRRAQAFEVEALRQALERSAEQVERSGEGWWRHVAELSRQRVVPVVAVCSLLVNGYFLAELVSRAGDQVSTAAIAINESAPASSVARQSANRTSVITANLKTSATTRVKKKQNALRKKLSVERKAVSGILAAPSRRLPPSFINPRTGLVRNNVQIACRPARKSSYLCVVKLPAQGSKRARSVRYRIDQKGNWTPVRVRRR